MGRNLGQVGKDASQKEAEGQASARNTEQGMGTENSAPVERLRYTVSTKLNNPTKALYKDKFM